ncbi:17301_t:CDS:1, partial [Acaulospora colombiana]
GGGLALQYASDGPERENLAGFIISAPLLHQTTTSEIVVVIGTIVSNFLPGLTISTSLEPSWMSHDSEFVEKCSEDPLM